jgi:hypothetical protein
VSETVAGISQGKRNEAVEAARAMLAEIARISNKNIVLECEVRICEVVCCSLDEKR